MHMDTDTAPPHGHAKCLRLLAIYGESWGWGRFRDAKSKAICRAVNQKPTTTFGQLFVASWIGYWGLRGSRGTA